MSCKSIAIPSMLILQDGHHNRAELNSKNVIHMIYKRKDTLSMYCIPPEAA